MATIEQELLGVERAVESFLVKKGLLRWSESEEEYMYVEEEEKGFEPEPEEP